MSKINLYNMDCMEAMAKMKDKEYDLAIVDPPYGIGNFWCGGDTSAQKNIKAIRLNERNWNNSTPDAFYFYKLKQVSVNQIVWGWNYYTEYLGSSESLIFWFKNMGAPNYSNGEIAWTSFGHKIKYYHLDLAKNNTNRTHPCQKPVALYRWLLDKYAKPGYRILDTHGGSFSSAIAAYDLGYDFTGYEIDEDYFKAGSERLKRHQAQGMLF
jgi:site-specific DNA-methyltransferase (adenine-specific)